MSRPIFWTPEALAKLVEMRNAGASWDAIADALGCSRPAALRQASYLRQHGSEVRLSDPAPSMKTHENLDRMRSMIGDGKPYGDAAKAIGVSKNTIRKWAMSIGIASTAEGTPVPPMADADFDKPPVQPEPEVKPVTRGTFGIDAIPPGHPFSWAAITAGTVLEGEEYRR